MGALQAGQANNVIPTQATLELSVRALDREVRVIQALQGTAAADQWLHGVSVRQWALSELWPASWPGYLTAPLVSPAMSWREATANSSSSGSVAMAEPAISAPHSA